jgi:hypothetical protein
MAAPESVTKRDGIVVPFERSKIAAAILQAQRAVNHADPEVAEELTDVVVEHLVRNGDSQRPAVEVIQDAVIYVLQESGHYEVALAYSRYRDARERSRRHRHAAGEEAVPPHLVVQDTAGRQHPWDGTRMEGDLCHELGLSAKVARDVRCEVERMLAESPATEVRTDILQHLVSAALCRCGLHRVAAATAPLCLGRPHVRRVLAEVTEVGAVARLGRDLLYQFGMSEQVPVEVARLYERGRLWVDGLDDPQRGSRFTATLEGDENPWRIITRSFALAAEAGRYWRGVELILPPMILGNVESDQEAYVGVLEQLARQATVYLYCDGRTPLLDHWPFTHRGIGLATYAQDFIILRSLQQLGLPHISGPHLLQGGYRRGIAISLALNAQGLEEQFSQLDHLAMGLVAAARVRLAQVRPDPTLTNAEIRFAIFGLSPGSVSNDYLERQVIQEGMRTGIVLRRMSSLPEEACGHLAKLFG